MLSTAPHKQKLKRFKQTKEIKYKVILNIIKYFGDAGVKTAATLYSG
jgi:hypothetical protein